MSSLLVIGGSGFFGKSILDAYRRGLLDTWDIDRIEVVARNASALLNSHPELISKGVNLNDEDIISCNALPVADYVIHAAASTDAKNYIAKPLEERKNIQLGTSNFCVLAKKYLAKSKILYVSSGAVYGQQPPEVSHISEDFTLQDIQSLDSGKQDYALAKRHSEALIQDLGNSDLNVIIARCFAFLGPYLPRNQHFAIGNFIEDGLHKQPIAVKAKCLVCRSYLHADDLVTWLMTIMSHADQSCPIVNVGSDEAISIDQLAHKVATYFNVKVNILPITDCKVDRYVPSIKKALSMGCHKPIALDNALRETIKTILYNF